MELTQKTIDIISNSFGSEVFEAFVIYIKEANGEAVVVNEVYRDALKEIDDATVTWAEMGYVLSMLVSNRFEHTEEKVNIKFTEAWNV